MKKQQRKTLSSRVLPQCIAVAAVLIVIDVLLMLLMREENQAVTLLCMAAADVLAAVWWIHCMRTAADEPLDELCDALDRYQSGEAVGLDRQLLDREDGIGVLARAVGQLSEEDDERLDEACREAAAQAESRARRARLSATANACRPNAMSWRAAPMSGRKPMPWPVMPPDRGSACRPCASAATPGGP